MGVFAVVKKAFGLSSKVLTLLCIIFLYNVVINLAMRPFQAAEQAAVGFTGIVVIVVVILAGIFFQGGMLGFLADLIKQGKSDLGKFLEYGKKFFVRLLGLAAIFALIGLLVTLLFGVIIPLPDAAKFIITLIIFAVIFIPLSYSPIALVINDIKIFEAVRQSVQFVKKNILKLIGLLVVLFLIALIAGVIVGFLISLLTFAASVGVRDTLMIIVGSAVNSYFNIILTSGLLAFYLALSGPAPEAKEEAQA